MFHIFEFSRVKEIVKNWLISYISFHERPNADRNNQTKLFASTKLLEKKPMKFSSQSIIIILRGSLYVSP